MRLAIKILVTVLVILAILYTVTYFILVSKAKTMLVERLEALTKKKVSVVAFKVIPLFNLDIKGLDIEGLVKIGDIYVSPSLLGFLSGKVAFNEIKIANPEFTYEKAAPAPTEPSATEAALENSGAIGRALKAIESVVPRLKAVTPAARKVKIPRLVCKDVRIQNGTIRIIDRSRGDSAIDVTVKDLNFTLTNFYTRPRSSQVTKFSLSGQIPWQDSDPGVIQAEGWLDLFKKDMRASIKIEGIDGISLYPYYSKWVDLEKTRIEKAKLNFNADLDSLNNDLTIHYRFALSDIVFKERSAEEEESKAEKVAHAVLDIFKALNKGKVEFEGTYHTKMDLPQFSFDNVKDAFENKLTEGRKGGGLSAQNIVMLPARLLQGTVKSITDLSKAVIGGTFSVGKELKKAVEDTFKKEPKAQN